MFITFRHLTVNDFEKIADLILSQLKDFLSEKGTKLSYTDDVLKFIAKKSYSEKFGARNMRRYIQKQVEDALAEIIVSDYLNQYTKATVSVHDGKIKVTCQ